MVDATGGPEFAGPLIRIMFIRPTLGPDVYSGGDSGQFDASGGDGLMT